MITNSSQEGANLLGNRHARKGEIMAEKTKRIHFFISEKEHEKLMRRVFKSGLTISAYMRHLINNRIPQDRPPAEYFEVLSELRLIGKNINQIAFIANATGIIEAAKYDDQHNELLCTILRIIDVAQMPVEVR